MNVRIIGAIRMHIGCEPFFQMIFETGRPQNGAVQNPHILSRMQIVAQINGPPFSKGMDGKMHAVRPARQKLGLGAGKINWRRFDTEIHGAFDIL